MDDKDKNFEKDLVNNLDQQREEIAAGAEIEAQEEQERAEYEARAQANQAEYADELAAGARIEETMQRRAEAAGAETGESALGGTRKDQMAIPGQEQNAQPAGRHGGLTEEQAKALLAQETQKTERKLEKAHKSNQKVAVIAVIVALVLCVAGLVFALVMGNRQSDDQAGDKGNADAPAVDENKPEPEKPEEPEDEVVALDVNDPVVQRLYGNFDVTNGQMYGMEEILQGKIPDDFMMSVARLNTQAVPCKLQPTDEILASRYNEDYIEMWGLEEIRNNSKMCYGGAATLEKLQDIFGKSFVIEDGAMTGSFTFGGQPHYRYDKANDEFYYYMMPGGGAGPETIHALYNAEKDGDSVYLYDVAGLLYLGCTEDARNCATPFDTTILEEGIDSIGSQYAIDYDLNNETILSHKDDFSKFKWIFTKNESGEYIFTGLERVK